ncbi:MAG TPA: Gfo/Idh/MocA family oxidoreductase [Candidatus Dormibacteraeota bacterium]
MLKVGILGAAGIAPAAIIRPASRRDDVTIAAVASRSAGSAELYAREHLIERAYGDYMALLHDSDIDLVYVPLPPSEHAAWSIAALEAGKDVLCEKPFAMNAVQAKGMRAAAESTGRRLIEAFHDRYHPLSLELDVLKASGRLGDIVSLDAVFWGPNAFDPQALRHKPELGGGSLMDLGCYPVHWVRAFMNEEPTVVSARAVLNPIGADQSMEASVRFPSGAIARISSNMSEDIQMTNSLDIVGTLGTAHVHNLVFPSRGHFIREDVAGIVRESTVRGATTYDHQLDAIVRGLTSGETLVTEGQDSVANMALIDAIYVAAGIPRDYL